MTKRTRFTPRLGTGCGMPLPARSGGFVVPRGITVLAGGTAAAGARSFTLRATNGGAQYSIGENRYLAENASTLSYEVIFTVDDDGHVQARGV